MRIAASILCIAIAQAESNTVWDGPGVTLLGTPSRDGRYLTYVEGGTGHLALRDLTTGTNKVLVKATGKQFAYFSTIAPDNATVAFAWFNQEGFYDLRIVDTQTGHVRTLFANEESGFVQPCAFSPDGSRILTLFFRKDNISQIALVPTAGGPPKILRSLNWVYPKKMDFSPDGTHIVYDSFADDKGPDRTLFLLRADAGGETRLLQTPGNHMFPVWTRAGIVYASGNDLMLLPQPGAAPRIWRKGLGRLVPLGATAKGDYYYGLRTGTIDVEVVSLKDPNAPPRSVSVRFPGRNSSPAWSPDGSHIAYLSRRGMENFGQEHRSIVVRSLKTGDERELETGLAHIASLRWSPDGKRLLAAGNDGQGRGGLFDVDATQGGAKLLLRDDNAGTGGVDGLWRDDSEIVYLAADGVHSWIAGKTQLLQQGQALRSLTAKGRHLAWLAPEGIQGIGPAGAFTLPAPARDLTELVFAGDTLLAGNGQQLWRVTLDGQATPLAIKSQRGGRLSLHPDGDRLAYSAGGTRSSIHKLELPHAATAQ